MFYRAKSILLQWLKKRNLTIALFCSLHSIFLIFLTFLWLNTTFMYEDEYMLIRITSAFKRLVLHIEEKPNRSEFLFVAVSWDKKLIDKLDEDGLPVGNQAITDRKKLADFFAKLNKNPTNHRYLVLDVFLKNESLDDSLLQAQLDQLQNYIISYHKKPGKMEADLPIFKANIGLSDYENSEEGMLGISAGGFAKYKIIQGDTLKTLPLRMYEKLYHKKISKGWLYDQDEVGTPLFQTFVVDHRIRAYDLFQAPDSLRYQQAYLGELVNLPDEFIEELTKDKIIIVGDFEDRDIHDTIYGSMPGPLILTNAFLALTHFDNHISGLFILLLFAGYLMVSYKCFYDKNFLTGFIIIRLLSFIKFNRMIANILGYFFFFLALSLLSYFLFDIHLSILLLAVYMELLASVIGWIKKKMRTRSKLIAAELDDLT